MARRLILTSFQSPGDIVMLSAAVRELHTAHPGKFQTDVRTSAPAIWEHSPYLTPLDEGGDVRVLDMHYPLVHQSNQRPYHFIHGYVQYLEQQLNVRIPVTQFRGDIHLSKEERNAPPEIDHELPDHYWIVVAGGKQDFTAKWWNPDCYQQVVDHFQGRMTFVQCGSSEHWHPPLKRVVNLVGKTTLRELIWLTHHSDGVLCPVTLAMHLAAAVETPSRSLRPCVVVGGGREPAHWESYPGHQYLSTIGMLECCRTGGCWKSRCQLVGDGDPKDTRDVCPRPVQVREDLRIPECMDMITPTDVIQAIDRFRHDQERETDPGDRRMTTSNQVQKEARGHVSFQGNGARRKSKVLLKFSHGLGDAVQFGIVLRHLQELRPDWQVDVLALRGKHSAMEGFCRRVFHDQEMSPSSSEYSRCHELPFHEQNQPQTDFPSTKAARCLLEDFGIQPDVKHFHYEITVSDEASQRAETYLQSLGLDRSTANDRYPVMLLHYQGNSSADKKDLSHETARVICETAIRVGLVPIILDWDRRSPLPDQDRVFCPPTGPGDLWGGFGSGDAETLAALIEQSALMVGVDSGPLHVAGATSTPTIGVWTAHFPAKYFDLAKNVTHLVPQDWRENEFGRDPGATAFFQKHYRYRMYRDLTTDVAAEIVEQAGHMCQGNLIRYGQFWVRRDNFDQDLVIVRDIYEEDAYQTRLLSDNVVPQVVVDIGAHIGCFAKLWHHKNPKARIICVEACPENIDALRANVGDFAEVVHAACTYETRPLALLNAVRPNCESTGGSVVVPREELKTSDLRQPGYEYWHDVRELPQVTLEDLMTRFDVQHVDILKLDCEGSEYSILGSSPSLHRIRLVLGEYHGKQRWDTFRQRHFSDWDYGHMFDAGESGGLFHLANPCWPPSRDVVDATEEPQAKSDSETESDLPASGPTLLCPPLLRVAVPAGIGDAVWALMKLPAMLTAYGAEKAQIGLCGSPPHRAQPFVERFDFVEQAEYSDWECVEQPPYTPAGVYNWAPSGQGWHHEFDWMLQANRHLESGNRLESWLPEFDTEWSIADHFSFSGKEVRRARELAERLGPYCVFYLGPELGNTKHGHNRGSLWSPREWGRLADHCRSLGLSIVVVGAEYDRSYFASHVAEHLGPCTDAIGQWPIGETFAVIQRARFVVAYQSGIGVFSTYLGIPTAMFWRPHGNSIDPNQYVSFREEMASAWVPIEALESGRYLPCIYTGCTPESIAEHARAHAWHTSK